MNRILLIRHGNTDMLGNVLCGRSLGVSLNASGWMQAVNLGNYFQRHEPLKAVFSSPLERAAETAECLATPQDLPVLRDERLQEVDFGPWTGKSFEELALLPEWRQYNEMRSLHHAARGESFPAVQGRAGDFLAQCARSYPDGTVAVVTHADVIRSLLCLCLGMPLDFILRLTIDTASVSEVSLGGSAPVIRRTNWRLPSAELS